MNVEMTHDELVELVACHAVGALEPDDVEIVERHLAGCVECAAELRDHHETLAALTPDEEASASVWSAIASELADTADADPGASVVPLRRRRAAMSWAPTALAAAMAMVLGLGLGLGLGSDDGPGGVDDALAAAFASSEATVAELVAGEDGPVAGRVALLPDGHAAIETTGLTPAAGRVLQVWAVVPTDGDPLVISVGLLDADGTGLFVLHGDPSTIVITDEPTGGSVVARGPAVAAGEITSA